MKVKFLDLQAQYHSIKDEIDVAIQSTINESAFIGGQRVQDFEKAFANYCSAGYCVGVGNGTDALEIAIEALSLPVGSEILVPGNSFIASSEAVTRCGHVVKFIDVEQGSYTINAETIKPHISDKTSAIVAVHLYGHPCDMAGILEVAREYNLRIIEDCAQAHGAEFNGTRVGAIGDVGTFSFYPGKNLGAYGDGGAIVTNDEQLAEKCRMIANHGRIAKYDHEFEGRNSRLDGLQAGILSVKLQHLENWTERRIAVADLYLQGLRDVAQIELPVRHDFARQVYHLFVVRVPDRTKLKNWLADKGIQTGVHYPKALAKLAAYSYLEQQNDDTFYNKTDEHLLSLPIGEHLETEQVHYVIEQVRSFFAAQ